MGQLAKKSGNSITWVIPKVLEHVERLEHVEHLEHVEQMEHKDSGVNTDLSMIYTAYGHLGRQEFVTQSSRFVTNCNTLCYSIS